MLLDRFKFNFSKAPVGLLYKINIGLIIVMLVVAIGLFFVNTASAGITLNTQLPAKDFNVPSGSLSKALATYSAQAGVVLVFDPILTDGRISSGIQGKYDVSDGFAILLKGTELAVVSDANGEYTLKRNPKVVNDSSNLPDQISLKETVIRAKRYYDIGPMPGLGLTKEEIPGNVQSITAKQIKEANSLSITDLMNTHLQSVNVNDYQSNPFQMDVTYRGFTASPQLGTSQGLSVFLDGIRVNEPFGDVVNWDMIPLNALSGIDVFPGSNPLFGLGTLGGAIAMKTKSGFKDVGGTTQILTGSFGRKQLQASYGGNNGVVAGFVAANLFMEDGWRDNSPSRVNQVFGKVEWRNDTLQLGLSTLLAQNKLVGNGLLPSEAIQQDPSSVFTSPDETRNRLAQFQLTGIWDITDNFNITGQLYRRNSVRKASTADINTDFSGYATRRPAAGEQVLPGYADANLDGLPDYNALPFNVAADAGGNALDTNGNRLQIDDGTGNLITNPASNGVPLVGSNFNTVAHPNQASVTAQDGVTQIPLWTYNPLFNSVDVVNTPAPGIYNTALPADYYKFAKTNWANKALILSSGKFPTASDQSRPDGFGAVYAYNPSIPGEVSGQYSDGNGFYVQLYTLPVINTAEAYVVDQNGNLVPKISKSFTDNTLGKPVILAVTDANGNVIQRDGGLADPRTGITRNGTGYVDGTPNAIITKTQIDQVADGGAMQLNWNLDKHKFMVGASLDISNASYASQQYLGIFDASHRGYIDPASLGYEYYAATNPVGLNDFSGKSSTRSLYASETWAPVPSLSLTAAARYNSTRINNLLAVNNIIGVKGPNSFLNQIDFGALCTDKNGDGTIDAATECPTGLDGYLIPFGPDQAYGLGALGGPERERFSYHSLNPSLGGTWQVNEKLNTYANWSRGARTPTVIELGCAFDNTQVPYLTAPDGTVITRARTLQERRFCTLPSTLSGDPYLKQVRSETFETGFRGRITEDIEWNASVYRTNLNDDIYFVSFQPDRSFFQNIGDTRRQGLELGLKGKSGRATFRLNYSLTDATFQSAFKMASPNNSSAGANQYDVSVQSSGNQRIELSDYQQIQVRPGDRMPGVPLHNINASVSYDVTDRWTVGLTAVLHSDAFVRGNENNKHKAGAATPISGLCQRLVDDGAGGFNTEDYNCDIARPDFRYGGKTAGYAVFNFQTSYKLDKGLTLGLLVNNIFDREYASAGRLGINAFSPSVNGAIGPSGFNYNSNDWRSSTFLAPGAPRAAWVSLTYDFDAEK